MIEYAVNEGHMGNYISSMNSKITALDKKKYLRDSSRTYTSGPEWRNVEMAEEFAAFLDEGKPFYRFPFFSQIAIFWKVFAKSYAAARREHGLVGLIFADHMLMNLFVGISASVEFAVLGLVSLFLWPVLRKENKTEFQQTVAQVFKDYADFIHQVPFYNYHYFSDIGKLFKGFWNSKGKSFADFVSLIVLSINFLAHGIIAAPVGLWYNQDAHKEAEMIDILVKQKTDDAVDENQFGQTMLEKIAALPGVQNVTEESEHHVFTRNDSFNHRTYAYAHLRVPRYEHFQETVKQLSALEINPRVIAGNDHIQLKCTVMADSVELLSARENELTRIDGCTELYRYKNKVNDKLTFFAMDVDTRHLAEVVNTIEHLEGASIKIMHDF